ncbi:hypothetical protein A4X06_0g4481, partial [Tilletia controversa]
MLNADIYLGPLSLSPFFFSLLGPFCAFTGLITGRTSVYLYDEKKAGLAAKKTTASVQSHELAHQWFGNIVTLTFWDCLWLNEAFATLMGE